MASIFMPPVMVDAMVDLSHWQSPVDFVAMKAAGVAAVMLKCTQGNYFDDPQYLIYERAALQAGLLVGAYHFFDGAIDSQTQLEYFLSAIGPDISVVAVDFEPLSPTAPVKAASPAVIAAVEQMCQALHDKFGRWPLLYTERWYIPGIPTTAQQTILTTLSLSSTLTNCPLWLAEYGTSPIPPDGWASWLFWQYTATGKIAGVSGKCDMDRFAGSLDDLKAWWAGTPAVPVTPPPPVIPPPPPPTLPLPEPVDIVMTTITDADGATHQIIHRVIAPVSVAFFALCLIAMPMLSADGDRAQASRDLMLSATAPLPPATSTLWPGDKHPVTVRIESMGPGQSKATVVALPDLPPCPGGAALPRRYPCVESVDRREVMPDTPETTVSERPEHKTTPPVKAGGDYPAEFDAWWNSAHNHLRPEAATPIRRFDRKIVTSGDAQGQLRGPAAPKAPNLNYGCPPSLAGACGAAQR